MRFRPAVDAERGSAGGNSTTKGSSSDWNCEAMIMKTTITARPGARPRPENVVRISSTCEVELDVAGPGIGAERPLEIAIASPNAHRL